MPSKKTEREHVPMIVIGNSDRPEATNLLGTTTTTTTTASVVETTNNYDILILQGTRDNWSNRIVYLLSIIGFVVDLGRFFKMKFSLKTLFFSFYRQCLAFSNNLLSKWWWCLSSTLFYIFISCRSSL